MSLIVHYPLNDDAANTSVADSSGNGYTGTAARNTSLLNATGKVNDCLQCVEASSDQIYLHPYASVDIGTQAHTLAFWVKTPASFDTYEQLVFGYNYSYAYCRYQLFIQTGEYLIFKWWKSGFQAALHTFDFDASTWYHIAVRMASGSQKLFLNGSNVASYSVAGFGTDAMNYRITIGSDRDTGDAYAGYTDCAFDDFRLYDEALSEWKIKSIYNFGKGSEECEPWQRLIQRTIQPVIQPLIGV